MEGDMAVQYVKIGGVEHVGCVLNTYMNDSYQVMSDVWVPARMVTVWNPDTKRPETFAATVFMNNDSDVDVLVTVDATKEVIDAFREYHFKLAFNTEMDRAEQIASKIHVGNKVRVMKGRKVPKGTVGKVVYIKKDGTYGPVAAVALDDNFVMVNNRNGRQYKKYTNSVWVTLTNLVRTDIEDIPLAPILDLANRDADTAVQMLGLS